MALKKEIVFENGISIKYHRIDEISVDNTNKQIKAKIVCYVNEDYRQSEKDNLENKKKYEELTISIFEENKKEESLRDKENIILWTNEANELTSKFKDNLELSAVKIDYTFSDVSDFSLSSLYEKLKEDDLFKDSENI